MNRKNRRSASKRFVRSKIGKSLVNNGIKKERKRYRSKKNFWLLNSFKAFWSKYWGTVISFILLMGFGLWMTTWRVAEINCVPVSGSCRSEVVEWLHGFESKPWYYIWFNLERDIKRDFAYVLDTKLDPVGYSILNVEVVISQPVMALTGERLSEQGRFFLINDRGKIIEEGDAYGLQVIKLKDLDFVVGEFLNKKQLRAVNLVRMLNYNGYMLTAEQTDEDNFRVVLSSGVTVWFSLADNTPVNELVSALQLILNRATIDPGKDEIDLRFNQPIIRDLSVTVFPTPTATVSTAPVEKE